jgi:septum site-determining protein MinD
MKMGASVYAFAGGKGGVGKTTTTANVAVALSEKGVDVAVVDADLGLTNLGELLGVESEAGIHDVLAGQASVDEVKMGGPSGVHVVPGGDSMQVTSDADPANLRTAIDPLRDAVDVVLLDTGAGISHQNLLAYGLSDAICLVTTADAVAVGDADKTGDLADRVDAPIVGTVVTRVDADTDVGDLPEALGCDLVAAIPEYADEDAPEPRVLDAPDSPAAAEYRRLATTLSVCHQTGDVADAASEASAALTLPEAPEPEESAEQPPGVIARLLGRVPLGR